LKILLTGFEVFGDNILNPSEKLLDSLPNFYSENITLLKLLLPVEKDLAPELVISALRENKYDVIMAFGLAAGRAKISIERIAINLMDFQIPDNAGITVRDQPVIADGPAAYFATLPFESMLNALQKANIPAELSLSAGSYICNQVFYHIMHNITKNNLSVKAGFIHLPALPETAAKSKKSMPSMSLDLIVKAAKIMITCLN
jgi:pyroglutamyl-peptidase